MGDECDCILCKNRFSRKLLWFILGKTGLSIKYSGMPETPVPSEHGNDLGLTPIEKNEDADTAMEKKEGRNHKPQKKVTFE